MDILLSFAWFAAFGILVNAIQRLDCGNIWYWGDFAITNDDFCGRWKAAEAFSFLSAIVWLASAFVVSASSDNVPFGKLTSLVIGNMVYPLDSRTY